MRFLIAAALFMISVFLLLGGLAQRTIWAPPTEIRQSIEADSASALVLIPNSVLESHPGTPVLEANAAGQIFMASGRESDIVAWIGNAEYLQVAADPKTKKLGLEKNLGVRNSGSPMGSDLWRTERTGQGAATLKLNPALDGAGLLASDGSSSAPQKFELVWRLPVSNFWSNALLIGGAAFLLAAIILNTIAYNVMRRKRGPRRRTPSAPKPPQYRPKKKANAAPVRGRRSVRRAKIALPASLTILALLTGCVPASSQSPSPSPSASGAEVPPAAVTYQQIKRILADTAQVAADADLTSDKKVLKFRFAGAALEQRTAHYLLRTRSTKVEALPAIVAKPISFSLPSATAGWPRAIMAVTDEAGNALPQMLVLEQQTPRSPYLLWYNIRLMPGSTLPEMPASSVGAIPVESNSLFLKMQPKDVAVAYGDVINKGASSLSSALFNLDKDEFYKQVSASQKSQVANLKTANMKFVHSLGDPNVISLATSNAGALVAVYMKDTYTIRPKKRGSAVAVTGQEKIMLGADGSTTGVRSVYGDMLLFYVPALSDDAQVKLLGATQGLVSVRGL
ncbi:hypothetical protein [Rhodoluna sp.]|uniref:hypothetical protein n=1 Tax=Rhodoluna sp. TaxID=1969481 RepID=UPI0025EE0E34|nr:hypothetical protein [Rhodoluna sp.]